MSLELAPGVVIAGRYQLERALGQGGMGVVWAAVHTVTHKQVALKFLKGPPHHRPELRRRFLREARAASAVVHPNVLEVHDVFELDDETPVMLMDLLEGETLGQRIARVGALPLGETADIMVQVVSGVGTAHTAGVVHRDLKPDNVFLVRQGSRPPSVRVLDFGIAKLVGSEGPAAETGIITCAGAMLGTPYYMSPEQSFGERDVDYRTDIWSLGAILYECLTGARPVEGDSIGQVVKRLVNDSITPISVLMPHLPRDVTELIERMLSRERDERPRDLREVSDVLARHASVRTPEFGAARDERVEQDLAPGLSASGPRPNVGVGSTLMGGRFRIARRIGEGGMGVVYEAHDEGRRGPIALKTLASLDAASVYGLKNEFRSLADVSHPNLCRLFELFREGEQWFFTMELVNGVPFDHWVRPHGKLDEARLRAALPELCEGIGAAHAAGKLHRDLKPSNVLVTAEGRVVILDFGLAVDPKLGSVGQTLVNDDLRGTPAYMAPEQAAGLIATASSDFYALGVMLFEALTGNLPFAGRLHDILVDKQRRDAPSVGASQPNVPSDLAALCDALLKREPAERPDGDVLRATLGAPRAGGAVRAPSSLVLERELLLGRDAELAQLHAAYEATRMGQPIVMFVSGESGMGKTALVTRFLDDLRASGHAVVLGGRCHERECVSFRGIDSLVDDISRFLRKLEANEALALIPREVYALARVFPVLGRVEAVAHAPRKDIVDPQELRRRAFAAFCELLARIRDRRPLVLHIDDAQWLDKDAVTFLGYVLAHSEPSPCLLLLTHRSEGASGHALLARVNQYVADNARLERRELSLGPLRGDAAEELAARLLGTVGASCAAEVALEASGSPFFVGELSRQARRSRGPTRLTLHGAVLAHVNELSSGAMRLLEVVAVAGRPLLVDVALDAAGASHEHVDMLHAERLLRRGDNAQGGDVECYHDKIRESVSQALSAERVRAAHASLLKACVAQMGADPEHLAVHAEGAGDHEAAARYAARAARSASESTAFEQAASLYARALELGAHDEFERRELGKKLGEVLANAGRGADAARAYLEAAEGAAHADMIELKRRAAEQLLISGHVDEGKAELGDVLHAVGLGLPESPKAALLSLGWERTRLALRGLSFRAREDPLPGERRRELDVLWTAARGLLGVDMFTGVALSSRYARLALASGAPEHAAQALASEAFFASAKGGCAAKARSDELLGRADALALGRSSPEVGAWIELCRGMSAWMQNDSMACTVHCRQAIEMLGARCQGVAFESGVARLCEHAASIQLGEFAPAAELVALVDEALRRGDLFTATNLTASGATARLIHGDVNGVERHIEQMRRHWPRRREYMWSHFFLLFAEINAALYSGDPGRAFGLIQEDWPLLAKGQFLRAPLLEEVLRSFRGRSALGVARLGGAGAEPARAVARGEARAFTRVRTRTATAFHRLLNAGLALDEARPERAVTELRAALTVFEAPGTPSQAAAVRRRLGQLLDGDEGAALVAGGESAFRAMGAVDVEAATRMFTWEIRVP